MTETERDVSTGIGNGSKEGGEFGIENVGRAVGFVKIIELTGKYTDEVIKGKGLDIDFGKGDGGYKDEGKPGTEGGGGAIGVVIDKEMGDVGKIIEARGLINRFTDKYGDGSKSGGKVIKGPINYKEVKKKAP